MPLHRVPRDNRAGRDGTVALEAKVGWLERAGERVLQVIPTNTEWIIVTVRTGPGGAVETR